MEALFACTKCHSRHSFEELSDGEQLCKDCRNNYPIVKCTFCRTEFQQEDKTSTNSICKKCAFNVKTYGKPSACEYCSIIAAFIGSKCQRCTNSEKRYGPPLQCEQCKQQCAFDRKDDSKKKVEGRMLCWMCTITYKRVLAKNRHKTRQDQLKRGGRDDSLQNTPLSSSGNTPNKSTPSVTPGANNAQSSESKSHHHHHHHQSQSKDKDKHHHHDHHHHKDKHRKRERQRSEKSEEEASQGDKETAKKGEVATKGNKENGESSTKKAKTEKVAANGLSRSSPGSSFNDFSGSEHIILITQLREEVEALKKQSALKEQSILDRDKKITELKAQNFEAEKIMRGKIQALQKEHNQSQENLQGKIRDLQRQVSSLSKTNRKAERTLERVASNSQLQQMQVKAEQEAAAAHTDSHGSNTLIMNSEFT